MNATVREERLIHRPELMRDDSLGNIDHHRPRRMKRDNTNTIMIIGTFKGTMVQGTIEMVTGSRDHNQDDRLRGPTTIRITTKGKCQDITTKIVGLDLGETLKGETFQGHNKGIIILLIVRMHE